MSIRPGVTIFPAASMTTVPRSGGYSLTGLRIHALRSRSTATIRPYLTPMSRCSSVPLAGSMTRPPRTTRSNVCPSRSSIAFAPSRVGRKRELDPVERIEAREAVVVEVDALETERGGDLEFRAQVLSAVAVRAEWTENDAEFRRIRERLGVRAEVFAHPLGARCICHDLDGVGDVRKLLEVDSEPPGDGGGRRSGRLTADVTLDRAARVDRCHDRSGPGVARCCNALRDQRRDRLCTRVEKCSELVVEQRAHARLIIDVHRIVVTAEQRLPNRRLDGSAKRGRVDTFRTRVAEAQREQEGRQRCDLDERALVVIPVRERQEVERLQQDRVDTARRDIRDERLRIRANIRVRRAQLRQVGVAERVAVGEFLDRPATINVEKNYPRIRVHPAASGNVDELGNEIAVTDQLTDHGLEAQVAKAVRCRLEEDRSRFLEVDDSARVVGEHVARVVIGGREADAVRTAALLDVFGDGVEPFVDQVGREREQRRPHAGHAPPQAITASTSTGMPNGRSGTPTDVRAESLSGPYSLRIRSEKPLTTRACAVNPSTAFTKPLTFSQHAT